ncbi:MAG TPA: TetR/AcrR family transcriptional regulator [Beijerinckiaceae bacterium]|jgi:AcrR family transcriptional regulator|nr:TetR/AcrR family transcriptional regulator [Beijerinckiaceae bacterium]
MDARTPPKRVAIRDAEATRRRILQAARSEFARVGLGGARIERIAEGARTNKRMLYYYFGNKEGLFLAALEATYDDIRAAERKLNMEALKPLEAIERLVRFTWDYFVAHPEFMMMLNSENLHKARHLKKSKQIHAMNSPLIATIGKILRRGEKEGTVRRGVDALQLYISIAALAYFYLSNASTLSVTFGRDVLSKPEMKRRIEHIVELVIAGLRP